MDIGAHQEMLKTDLRLVLDNARVQDGLSLADIAIEIQKVLSENEIDSLVILLKKSFV